ncbi:AAA family ATPase [Pararhodospirillum oryzae]|uniref:ATPase AAA-type core domain-containing protein n=1 Tax=Pararhodospirillum oryzae TaxID=478448 RepID=A0A512HAF0_9PROT|nr:AAA family ATPase [Pararhodospirillum oryzae]GEO82433.1 hypothetical protein ROR02_25640 [Pararhodospirillum oryzae]
MLTRIEIDGFKTFEHFAVDVSPFGVMIGPSNAGKSNLFDALRFLSLLSRHDVPAAMRGLRGRPEELFRRTADGATDVLCLAVEVLLPLRGTDDFGTPYELEAQRLRYEVTLTQHRDPGGQPREVVVSAESCRALTRDEERAPWIDSDTVAYARAPHLYLRPSSPPGLSFDSEAIPLAHGAGPGWEEELGLPPGGSALFSGWNAARTALSVVMTAEQPHLFALRALLSSIRLLDIDPVAARRGNDAFEERTLRVNAGNLATVLADLREETASPPHPEGVMGALSTTLAQLVPMVRGVRVRGGIESGETSFDIETTEHLVMSARQVSNGTVRALALLAALKDPIRAGLLCIEEPDAGLDEDRLPVLASVLRQAIRGPALAPAARLAGQAGSPPPFQILATARSSALAAALEAHECLRVNRVLAPEASTSIRPAATRMTWAAPPPARRDAKPAGPSP